MRRLRGNPGPTASPRRRYYIIYIAITLAVAAVWRYASSLKHTEAEAVNALVSNVLSRPVPQPHPFQHWLETQGGHTSGIKLQQNALPPRMASDLEMLRDGYAWIANHDIPSGTRYLEFLRRTYRSLPVEHLQVVELYLLVHFEKYVERESSLWAAYLAELPEQFDELPLFFSNRERTVLTSLPQGGQDFTEHFDAVSLLTRTLSADLCAAFPEIYRPSLQHGTASELDENCEDALVQQLVWAVAVVHKLALDRRAATTPPKELMIIPGLDISYDITGKNTNDVLAFEQKLPPKVAKQTQASISIESRDSQPKFSAFQVAAVKRSIGSVLRVRLAPDSSKKCLSDFLVSYGFLPADPSVECLYFRVKYTPFQGNPTAEDRRQNLLHKYADGVRHLETVGDAEAQTGNVELKFSGAESAVDRILHCFSILLLRPFHFESESSTMSGIEQLTDFSLQRAYASVQHLKDNLGSFFEKLIEGEGLTDNTFQTIYKLQERSERAATRVLAELGTRLKAKTKK